MNKLAKAAGILGASAALAFGGLAPAQANHTSGGTIVTYSYHYDWRCQWNIKYAGEPFYKGYLYKVWYKTTHVDYAQWQTDYYGYRDYSTTAFSHRQYSTSFPRCAGGEW